MLPKTPRPPHSLSLLPVNFQNVDFGGWQSPRWQIPGSLNGCVEQSPFPPVTLVELICCNSYLSLVGLKGGRPCRGSLQCPETFFIVTVVGEGRALFLAHEHGPGSATCSQECCYMSFNVQKSPHCKEFLTPNVTKES